VQDKAIRDHLEEQLNREDGRKEVIKIVEKLKQYNYKL
jgi:hypothetical protein